MKTLLILLLLCLPIYGQEPKHGPEYVVKIQTSEQAQSKVRISGWIVEKWNKKTGTIKLVPGKNLPTTQETPVTWHILANRSFKLKIMVVSGPPIKAELFYFEEAGDGKPEFKGRKFGPNVSFQHIAGQK